MVVIVILIVKVKKKKKKKKQRQQFKEYLGGGKIYSEHKIKTERRVNRQKQNKNSNRPNPHKQLKVFHFIPNGNIFSLLIKITKSTATFQEAKIIIKKD